MNYSDDMNQSGEYLRLSLSHMTRYKIPVSPLNYTVWYEYVSGKNSNLNAAIESLIKHSTEFSKKVHEDLYKNYIAEADGEMLEKVREEVRRILAEIMAHITDAGGEASQYGKSLEGLNEQLAETVDVETIQNIVDNIITDTKTMEESNDLLTDRLQAATSEVEALRTDLQRLKQEATTDALTGLANRRTFDEALADEMGKAIDSQSELSFLLADIDHFKRINDNFGHIVGDKVLRTTAQMIKKFVRGKDVVARYGGEEFAIILPDTPHKGALTVAEKIRSEFEAKQWKMKGTGKSIGIITLSLGAALYKAKETPEALIERADKALYFSKENGRNQVTSENDIDGPGLKLLAK